MTISPARGSCPVRARALPTRPVRRRRGTRPSSPRRRRHGAQSRRRHARRNPRSGRSRRARSWPYDVLPGFTPPFDDATRHRSSYAIPKDDSTSGRWRAGCAARAGSRAEVAGIRWSELRDLDGDGARWEIPAQRTKNKRGHVVPLAASARALVPGLPRVGDLVFTTTGDTPFSGFGRAKWRLDIRIAALRAADGLLPMPPWILHDLRRTMVTLMNERLSVPPHIVEAVVNHVSGAAKAGIAGVDNRALYLDDRRAALEKWSKLMNALGPPGS